MPTQAGAEDLPAGLADRLRSLAASVVELAHARLQLLGADAELQVERVRDVALFGAAAAMLFALALAFASMLVVAVYWDTHRLTALAVVALVHGAGALACIALARRALRSAGRPFEASIDELRRDVEQLRTHR